jgi:hypothetical protein
MTKNPNAIKPVILIKLFIVFLLFVSTKRL